MTILSSHKFHSRGCVCCGTTTSRRQFLAGAAAIGTTAILSGSSALAQQKTLIDTHHHFYPPAYQELWMDWEDLRKLPHFPGQVAWSKAKALEDMDNAGIRVGILSIASTPGVWFDLGAEKAGQLARDCNDFAAKMMRDSPGRFGLLRRCRCSISTRPLRKSNMFSTRSKPTAWACRPIMAING